MRETRRERKKNPLKKRGGERERETDCSVLTSFGSEKSKTARSSTADESASRGAVELHNADIMFVFSLPFLAFALPILQHCLTAAHPIKAPARIDLQPLLTLMQMSCAQLIGVALAAAGWSSGFRGNFESRKRALTVRAAARLRRHFLRDVPARGVKRAF